jgi:hypothetical protein
MSPHQLRVQLISIKSSTVTDNLCLGLAPRIMGIGPSIAIPMALEKAGITKDDVDLFEVCTLTCLYVSHSDF